GLVFSNINQFFIESSYSRQSGPPVSLVPMKLTAMKNFNGVGRRIPDVVEEFGISNAVVFVQDHRWQGFGSVSSFNRPTLDTPVVYAKDLGAEINEQVMKAFPDREYYWTAYPRVQLHRLEWDETKGELNRIRLMTPEEQAKIEAMEKQAELDRAKYARMRELEEGNNQSLDESGEENGSGTGEDLRRD
ncbi:MAG TPA: hypothetical protein PLV45_08605, partial [bacterium]|nr:hypothetical protein [bacterium]